MTAANTNTFRIIVIGQMFDRWQVTGEGVRRGKNIMIPCRCQCGTERSVQRVRLLNGTARSCGCRGIESNTTHGCAKKETRPKEYGIWKAMRQRCQNPNVKTYSDYGGRGITVDPRWDDFANFISDMGPRPGPKWSIDRIDNDKGYSPDNCRWVTRTTQSRNTRKNRMITIQGETKCMAEWSSLYGIKNGTVWQRIKAGWNEVDALTTPVDKSKIKLQRIDIDA